MAKEKLIRKLANPYSLHDFLRFSVSKKEQKRREAIHKERKGFVQNLGAEESEGTLEYIQNRTSLSLVKGIVYALSFAGSVAGFVGVNKLQKMVEDIPTLVEVGVTFGELGLLYLMANTFVGTINSLYKGNAYYGFRKEIDNHLQEHPVSVED